MRILGLVLLGLIGAVTAEGTQAIGALLVLGLIAAPAGAALRVTSRPYLGMVCAVAIAVVAMWGGIALSYAIPSLPPSTAIVGLAVGAYLLASMASTIALWTPRRSHPTQPQVGQAQRRARRSRPPPGQAVGEAPLP